MRRINYGSDEFERFVTEIGEAVSNGEGRCLVFAGGRDERRREALNAIGDRTTLNVHRRDAATLIGENAHQTQGLIREAFDTASEGASILYLENADAIFADSEREAEERQLDADAQTAREYLFQRMNHRSGVTILALGDARHQKEAENVAHAVVELPDAS